MLNIRDWYKPCHVICWRKKITRWYDSYLVKYEWNYHIFYLSRRQWQIYIFSIEFKMGWGTNNKNINIDDCKWLTSTTFSSPRNINIEKVCRRYSSFFFWARPIVDVILCPIRKWKKKNGNNVECHYIWGLKTIT